MTNRQVQRQVQREQDRENAGCPARRSSGTLKAKWSDGSRSSTARSRNGGRTLAARRSVRDHARQAGHEHVPLQGALLLCGPRSPRIRKRQWASPPVAVRSRRHRIGPPAAVGERRQFRRDGVGVGLIALESSPQTPPGRLNAGDAVLAYQRPSASLAAAHDRRTQGGSSSRHSTVGVGSTYRHPIDRSLWRCRARSLPNPASARTQTYPKLRSVPSLGQLERRCDVHAGSQGQPPCTPRQVAFAVRDGRSMIKGSPKT